MGDVEEELKSTTRELFLFFLKMIGIIILLGLIVQGIGWIAGSSPTSDKKFQQNSTVEEPQKLLGVPDPKLDQPPKEPPPLTPAQRLTKAKEALDKKLTSTPLGRLGDAEEHLAEIPEDAKEYKEALRLKKEVERRQKKADTLTREIMGKYLIEKRKTFANELETRYLDKGMDITVTVSGPQNTVIKLKYVLFSRPMIYKLAKEGFLEPLKEHGFKKVIFMGAFRQSWTYDLAK